jgi:hypothetical protein
MAQNGHAVRSSECLLLRAKRTLRIIFPSQFMARLSGSHSCDLTLLRLGPNWRLCRDLARVNQIRIADLLPVGLVNDGIARAHTIPEAAEAPLPSRVLRPVFLFPLPKVYSSD